MRRRSVADGRTRAGFLLIGAALVFGVAGLVVAGSPDRFFRHAVPQPLWFRPVALGLFAAGVVLLVIGSVTSRSSHD